MELSDVELIREYRMPKAAILELCAILQNDLESKYQGERILTVQEQVLISLKLLASGSFQNSTKDNINVSQPTVSCVLNKFMKSLISYKERFIQMPSVTDIPKVKQQFYSKACFPGVIGAIDCTHVALIAPKDDEHLYVNRKHTHSINIQVCRLQPPY